MDLNREVAEKVMGWRYIREYDYKHSNDRYVFKTCLMQDGNDTMIHIPEDWNPLKDLNQCFEVVEKLSKTHDFWVGRRKEWLCQFFPKGSYIFYEKTGKTPNEAILKAALEAVKGG